MKKWIAILMSAVVMLMPVSAYATNGGGSADDAGAGESAEDTVIPSIQDDFSATIEQLQSDLEGVHEGVGDTYDAYVENKGLISDWYENCKTSLEELLERTYDSSVEYYNYVASSVEHEDEALDAAMTDFYDGILDDAFDGFYDDILEDAFNDIYDTYYDVIISEGEKQAGFSGYLEECSDFYKEWLNEFSDVYAIWLDEFSSLYADWFAVYSAFIKDGNFDVDAIMEAVRADDGEVLGEELDDSAVKDIQDDFLSTIEQLMKGLEDIYEEIGVTYEDYAATKDKVSEWYDDCDTLGTELLERARESSEEFYNDLAAVADKDNVEVIEDALNEYYELVLRDSFNGFYDEILNGGLNSIRDSYFEVIINADIDSSEMTDWNEESKDFYSEWVEAYYVLYQGWSNAFMDLYSEWSAIWDEFVNNDNYDVDAILAEYADGEQDETGGEEDSSAL